MRILANENIPRDAVELLQKRGMEKVAGTVVCTGLAAERFPAPLLSDHWFYCAKCQASHHERSKVRNHERRHFSISCRSFRVFAISCFRDEKSERAECP